jgi:geranylgeranyl diphosphate synthase type II
VSDYVPTESLSTESLSPETLSPKLLRHALFDRIMAALPSHHEHSELAHFYELICDYPQRGGKYLRGQLVLLSAAMHSQQPSSQQQGASWQAALDVAAALELFQNWVLIHDDIEDDSEERRGKPALHVQAGMPLALNAGDALHVYMWQLLHSLEHLARWREVLTTFGWMIQRTAEGQHLDLSWVAHGRFNVSEAEYLEMITHKTAYYTVIAPLQLGALCVDVAPNERFVTAGKALGVAFQIRDDVLNLMPDVSYGKEFAGDLFEAKRTLILAHTFSHATASESAELCERLAKPRANKVTADIDSILALIDKYKSLEYAQAVAERYAKEGLQQLREVISNLPNQDAAQKIIQLAESLASRRM